jgi:hypothetical protein
VQAVVLTERDREVLRDLARFRVLTTEQLWRRHFADTGRETCQNRLCALATAGYVERRAWGYDHGVHRHRAGWLLTQKGLRHSEDVTVHYTCGDTGGSPSGVSGVATCPADQTYTGTTSVTGTATDRAGNASSTPPFQVNIDKAPPTIAISAKTEWTSRLRRQLAVRW